MLLHNIIKYCHLYKILLHLYVIINQFFSAIYLTIVITDTRFCIHIFVFFIYLFIYLILENIRQSCECNSEKLRRVIARNCKVEFNKTAKYDSTIITIKFYKIANTQHVYTLNAKHSNNISNYSNRNTNFRMLFTS